MSRPGLSLIVREGRQFEREKFAELTNSFGDLVRSGPPVPYKEGEETAFAPTNLEQTLGEPLPPVGPGAADSASGHRFIIEAEYPVTAPFLAAHELRAEDVRRRLPDRTLSLGVVRPDILHVCAADGRPREAITPLGDIVPVAEDDLRTGLRVIDIKLGGEPTPSHFAELAYYQMTLAAWLEHTGRHTGFVVLKNAAIWPGKHDASTLRTAEEKARRAGVLSAPVNTLIEAWTDDLEELPAEVVLPRVRRFLSVDLWKVLEAGDWKSLPWFVGSACSGCDYLGYDWKSGSEDGPGDDEFPTAATTDRRREYCWPMAAQERHLSMVTGLTRGSCGKLVEGAVANVAQLADLKPTNVIFEGHQKLRAGRSVLQARAETLSKALPAQIPDKAGTSAVLPKNADVKVALSIDYDVGSGVSFAIGYRIIRSLPTEYVATATGGWFKSRPEWDRARVMLVERKDLLEEREVFMELMRFLVMDLRKAQAEIEKAYVDVHPENEPRAATFQIYLWDRLNYDHLCRVVGRHLLAIMAPPIGDKGESAAPIAWLFPPETVIKEAGFTSKNAPISILSDATSSLLAANVPHHYALMGVGNAFYPAWMKPSDDGDLFRVRRLLVDPLSDQLPSERGHEIWRKKSPYRMITYQDYRGILMSFVARRLDAVLAVADRMTDDLDGLSSHAPTIASALGQTNALGAIARDSEILFQHARLMHAAAQLENELLLALPPHQREATFASARMEALLEGAERADALAKHSIAPDSELLVFRMSKRSVQTKIKEGDFNWSLMPEAELADQHMSVAAFKKRLSHLFEIENRDYRASLRSECRVDVVAFGRVDQIVVLRPATELLRAIIRHALFDFHVDGGKGEFAILDPLVIDYFVGPRLKRTLKAIKTPPLSRSQPLFTDPAISRLKLKNPRETAPVPAERFIWDASALSSETTGRDGAAALAFLKDAGWKLTERQEAAVRQSVERRLSLLWGPPGTGKSTTSVALLAALLEIARRAGRPIRIAVTGPTWVAIDTVVKRMPKLVQDHGLDASVARLSAGGTIDTPELTPFVVEGAREYAALAQRLRDLDGSIIVAGTAQQLGRLATDGDAAMAPFFDFMLVDEASQMSVSHAVVAFATLADGASVTVVGDDLQMPPIQPIEPPAGAEHLVGSVYSFFREYRKGDLTGGITPVMLERSFRSNAEIVDFVRLAGYRPELTAHQPGLRMKLQPNSMRIGPAEWPTSLPRVPAMEDILDPQRPLVAIIHDDIYSSQRNDQEAAFVAALVWTLRWRMLADDGAALDPVAFYNEGVGVVTPHRAQQSAITDHLLALERDQKIATAAVSTVDTVERFQGQEKTAMIASFGLGDVDQIAAEESFLYSLNRFNVIASRAKAKLVVIVSRELLDYLPKDPKVLRASRLLKRFGDGHLLKSVRIQIPGMGSCEFRHNGPESPSIFD